MAGRFSITAAFQATTGNMPRVFAQVESGAARMQRRFTAAFAGLHGGLSKAATVSDRFVAKLADVGKSSALLSGLGIATATAKIVTSGADFEEAISSLGAVSLMSRDQIKDLEQEALRLGSTTRYTSTQVANGMELMGRAGFTNSEILKGIPGLLSAAAAEGGELAETVGIVSNTLKGFGLAANQTQRVADVLTLASARTNSSITSLGESLKNVAPIARQFGIPMEDATAAVALLQDVGIDASEAGNATSTMLTMLAAPTKEASKQMAALGIKIADTHGNMLPLPKIFSQFSEAANKAGGNAKAAAVFSDLLGMRGQRAGINLTNAFASGAFGKLVDELEHAEGSAKRMADLRMDNVKGSWELFTGSIDGVSTAIYNLQSGPLRGVIDAASNWVARNQNILVQRIDRWVGGATKALREAVPVVISFTSGLADGARDVMGALNAMKPPVVWVLDHVGSLFGSDDKDRAHSFGRTLVIVGGGLAAVSAAARITTGLKWGYTAATVVAKGVTWAFTGSVIKSAEAQVAAAGATNAANTATIATVGSLKSAGLWFFRLAALIGVATAAYKSWKEAFSLNDDLKKQTGGLGFFDVMSMHPKDVKAAIDKNLDAEARARNPENAAAWAQRQYGSVAAAQVAPAAWARKATDVQLPTDSLFGDFDKQFSEFTKMPGLDSSAIKQLESSLAAVKEATATAKLADGTANVGKELEQLTASLQTLQASMPAGMTGMTGSTLGAAAASPSGGGAAPMTAPALAPQLIVPREQTAEQATMIAAAVERAIKRGMEQASLNVNVNGASSPSGGPPKSPRAGVNVSDSGGL
jgi:TP901 family phage tail tape measure protein